MNLVERIGMREIPEELPLPYKRSIIARLKAGDHVIQIPGENNLVEVHSRAHNYLQQGHVREAIFGTTMKAVCRDADLSHTKGIIVITGYVQNDGIGDLGHMKYVARKVKEIAPDADVIITAEVENFEGRAHYFANVEFETISWDPLNRNDAFDRAGQIASKAFLILEISHNCTLNSSVSEGRQTPYYRITEYGSRGQTENLEAFKESRLDSFYRALQDETSMGMGPFQMGIRFEDQVIPKKGLKEIKSLALHETLFARCEGDEAYERSHILHFGYFHDFPEDHPRDSHFETRNFINLNLSAGLEDKRPHIDIILPQNNGLTSALDYQMLIDPSLLENVSEIHVLKLGKSHCLSCKKINPQGKIIRFIDPFPLLPQDMQLCMANALGAIGCTGDNSFSEVLSLNAVPYYGVRKFKRDFFDSFIAVAEEFFQSGHAPYVQYLRNCNSNYKEAAAQLKSPGFLQDAARFYIFLKNHCNFNEMLTDFVKKKLLFLQKPELKQLEYALLEEYEQDKRSLVSCYNELKKATTVTPARSCVLL